MFCKHTHYQYAIQDLVWPDGIEPPTWDYESHELPLLHGHTSGVSDRIRTHE
jgi:hypothetical protein